MWFILDASFPHMIVAYQLGDSRQLCSRDRSIAVGCIWLHIDCINISAAVLTLSHRATHRAKRDTTGKAKKNIPEKEYHKMLLFNLIIPSHPTSMPT